MGLRRHHRREAGLPRMRSKSPIPINMVNAILRSAIARRDWIFAQPGLHFVLTGWSGRVPGRLSDHVDPAIPETIDATDHFQFALLDGRIQDRCCGFELCDIVDDVLPDGVVERIALML